MSRYDNWLQSGAHENEDWQDKTDERVKELLKGEYAPYTETNIQEALNNDCLQHSIQTIITAIENDDLQTVGLLFKTSIYTYWEIMAENHASDDYNQGFLG